MSQPDTTELSHPAVPVRCTQCDTPLEIPVVCRHCHAVMPEPSGLDHFDRMGMPRRYDVDLKELERKYLAWSRELHPDYFTDRAIQDQQLSLQLSSGLNRAYRTLKDPVMRALYLLSRIGGDAVAKAPDAPPEFLAEMFDIRERIAGIRAAGRTAEADQQRRALEKSLRDRHREALRQIAEGFGKLAADDRPGPDGDAIDGIRAQLTLIKYLDGQLGDLTGP